MYGTNVFSTGLTLGKVLSGISKGLSIANQVIPIYQQAKPMISNARKMMAVLKDIKDIPSKTVIDTDAKEKNVNPNSKKVPEMPRTLNNSNPVFFQ